MWDEKVAKTSDLKLSIAKGQREKKDDVDISFK